MAQQAVRVTDSGDVPIPEEIRRRLGITPGDAVALRVVGDGPQAALEITVVQDERRENEQATREARRVKIQRQIREDAQRLPPLTMTLEQAFGSVPPLFHLSDEEIKRIVDEERAERYLQKMRGE